MDSISTNDHVGCEVATVLEKQSSLSRIFLEIGTHLFIRYNMATPSLSFPVKNIKKIVLRDNLGTMRYFCKVYPIQGRIGLSKDSATDLSEISLYES